MRGIVGRDPDIEAVRRFVSGDGRGALFLEGEPGIGKTTVWQAGVDAAQESGAVVLLTRPSESEASLAFAALADFLRTVPEVTAGRLPISQRVAMDVALARADPSDQAPDLLALSLALLGTLRFLAEDGPVVIAIDDLQWIDPSSRHLLEFALRRLDAEPVRVLATVRVDGDASVVPTAEIVGDRRHIGRLPVSALGEILQDQLGSSIPRPILNEIHATAAGNPFYALEIGRALIRMGGRPVIGQPLPIPATLSQLVRSRVATLSDAALEVVLVIASAARARPRLIEAAVGDEGRAASALEEAEAAGILALREGEIVFTHPLLASTIYAGAPEAQRRRLHGRLADLADGEEERARHVALATIEPDESAAETLQRAAESARKRGAPAAAARLYEESVRLTPTDCVAERSRRQVEAASAHFASGDARRAKTLLEDAVEAAPAGTQRAAVLEQLATVSWATDGDRAAVEAFERALSEATESPLLLGGIHDNLAWLTCWLGDMPAAYAHIQTARDAAERTNDPALLARVLDKYGQIEFQVGEGPGLDVARKAVGFEAAAGAGIGEATLNETLIETWSDRLDEARASLERYLAQAIETGQEGIRPEILVRLALLEIRAGNWSTASRHADAAFDAAAAAGLDAAGIRRTQALVAALRGDVVDARRGAVDALTAARIEGQAWVMLRNLGLVGLIDLSLGHSTTASQYLDEAAALCQKIGVAEPGIFRVEADAVEALIAVGSLDRATEILERFERNGNAIGRRWAMATAARCRAMLEAARGRDTEAMASLDAALVQLGTLGQPFELARTLLVAGTIHRRARRKAEARRSLTEAIEMFDRLGARLWSERAHAELARISGRAPGGDGLTPTELRVAELVVAGSSNREVADQLFITVRTVETNLTRVYQKLGVSSRTQLARGLAANRPQVEV